MDLAADNLTITVLPDGDAPLAMAYTVMDREELERLMPLIRGSGLMVCAVTDGVDWDRDLSPWPARAVFRNDFSGGAEHFLRTLTARVIPLCERHTRDLGLEVPRERVIFGYSLCGLFALWSAVESDAFTRVASMSGSLWFDGFSDWFATRADQLSAGSVYLSLGDRECRARDPRMARVEEATRGISGLLSEQGTDTVLVMESGGHFRDVPERIARGLLWTAGRIRDLNP